MDMNKIHYFLTAARMQNFTKAAKTCHIAQTTMSKYITVLEQELGCQLFIRNHKTARLTSQGERFYEGMKKISKQYQELCCEINRDESKELRIGMIPTDYADFPILRSFEQTFPEISVYYTFGEEEKLLTDLQHHRLNALICPNILSLTKGIQDEFVRINLCSIEESLVCSRELLERCGSMEEVIATQPMITKAAEKGYQDFSREKFLELYGRSYPEVIIASGLPQQLLFLNLSRGFAIIPSQTGAEYESLVSFPTPEVFFETAQLLYQPDYVTASLQMLLLHIHEKEPC